MRYQYRYDEQIRHLLDQLRPPQLDEMDDKFRLQCPFPDHRDSTPSFYISRRLGAYHCFGCRRHGSLKRMAQELNLTLPDSDETDITGDETDHWVFAAQDFDPELLDGAADLAIGGVPLVIEVPRLLRPLPQHARWRRLPAKLLAALGARLWYDDTIPGCEIERIWFPVQQERVLAGWFARVLSRRDHQHHPHKNTIPKYRNNDSQRTKQLLFPYDYVRTRFARRRTVAVVEGQVDALTLIQADIPALAIFGTNNWSKYKEGLLAGAGFTNVIVAMDGDKPGRKLQVELVPQLRHNFDRVFDFRVPHHHDPASMPPEYRVQLRRLAV